MQKIVDKDSWRSPACRQSPTLVRPVMMCAAYECFYAIKSNGQLFGCGGNRFGELGLGDNDARFHLTKIADLQLGRRVKICAGQTSFYLIDSRGSLFACGENNCGQLGLGDTINRYKLTKLNFPRQRAAAQFCADMYSLYLLDVGGCLYACGANNYGQLGVGDEASRKTLTKLEFPRLCWNAKICARFHALFVFDGKDSIFTCGKIFAGLLGEGLSVNELLDIDIRVSERTRISAGLGFCVD